MCTWCTKSDLTLAFNVELSQVDLWAFQDQQRDMPCPAILGLMVRRLLTLRIAMAEDSPAAPKPVQVKVQR
jgi:hypothetical protein